MRAAREHARNWPRSLSGTSPSDRGRDLFRRHHLVGAFPIRRPNYPRMMRSYGGDAGANSRETGTAAKVHGRIMAMPADAATALSVVGRLLLLCVAAEIDFKHAKIADRCSD